MDGADHLEPSETPYRPQVEHRIEPRHELDEADHLSLSHSGPSTRDDSSCTLHVARRDSQILESTQVMGQHMGLGSPYYNRKVGHATLVYYVWGMGMYGLCFRLGPHKNWITPDPRLDLTRNLTCRFLLFNLTLAGFVFLPRSLSLPPCLLCFSMA